MRRSRLFFRIINNLRGIGHELLSFLFRYTHKNLSTRDPVSVSTFFQSVVFATSGFRFLSHSLPDYALLRTATIEKTVTWDGFSIGCAGERNRTPIHCLEGSCFTTKLHPQGVRSFVNHRNIAYLYGYSNHKIRYFFHVGKK